MAITASQIPPLSRLPQDLGPSSSLPLLLQRLLFAAVKGAVIKLNKNTKYNGDRGGTKNEAESDSQSIELEESYGFNFQLSDLMITCKH